MNIEQIAISDLLPYPNNAKQHSETQILKLAGIIKEYGFNVPLVIDKDNGVICGHGRLEAARKLGLKKVPCLRKGDLTKAQVRAFRIADNKITESPWLDDLLALELADLQELDVDLEGLGFESWQVDALLQEGEFDINKEWQGMPEFEQEDKTAYQTIHVHFATEKDVQDFAGLVGQGITEKTKYLWFPKQEKIRYGEAN
jgi:ParB-like chromosome segregation protein Spo0J